MSVAKFVEVSAAVVVAICAVVAGFQFSKGQELQADNLAFQSWERFLEVSIQNPNLAGGINYTDELEAETSERYVRFVDRFLVSAELVLAANPDDVQWRSAIAEDIAKHQSYLSHPDFLQMDGSNNTVSGYCSYSEEVRQLIKESFGRGGRTSPSAQTPFAEEDENCMRQVGSEAEE